MLAAAVLMMLHLGAFFQADDVIMREIPGSHPYLTGLGILGGMYSFDNPLQGRLQGLHLATVCSRLYYLLKPKQGTFVWLGLYNEPSVIFCLN